MPRFLFWNMNRKALVDEAAALVNEHRIDVLVIGEPGALAEELRRALGEKIPSAPFELAPSYFVGLERQKRKPARLQVFLRNTAEFWTTKKDDLRYLIAHYRPPATRGIILVAAHLPSQQHWKTDSIGIEAGLLAEAIREREIALGTSRTVVFGDLNLNPFDVGIVGAKGLHGVASRMQAKRLQRKVNGRDYKYFYNPMWNLFGDQRGAPGSYYYGSSEYNAQFWHIFDQVLIRPELIDEFVAGSLEILTSIEGRSLLTRTGLPRSDRYSDHLPLKFELDLTVESVE